MEDKIKEILWKYSQIDTSVGALKKRERSK